MARQSTFGDMAAAVETALHRKRAAEQMVADRQVKLAEAQTALRQAEEDFVRERDAFHSEFPEMAPPAQVATADMAPPPTPQQEAQPAPVMTSQGPVVFREMDESPFGGD